MNYRFATGAGSRDRPSNSHTRSIGIVGGAASNTRSQSKARIQPTTRASLSPPELSRLRRLDLRLCRHHYRLPDDHRSRISRILKRSWSEAASAGESTSLGISSGTQKFNVLETLAGVPT